MQKRKQILFGCIFASLAIHFSVLFALNKKMLSFCSPYSSLVAAKTSFERAPKTWEKEPKEEILDIALETKSPRDKLQKAPSVDPKQQQTFPDSLFASPSFYHEYPKQGSPHIDMSDSDIAYEIAANDEIVVEKAVPVSSNRKKGKHCERAMAYAQRVTPFFTLEKISPPKTTSSSSYKKQTIEENKETSALSFQSQYDKETFEQQERGYDELQLLTQIWDRHQQKDVVAKNRAKSKRSVLPELAQLQTICCSDDFDIDVSYVPYKNEYLFAITLIPARVTRLKKIPQNFYFLLDTSNSIQRERLTKSRHALISSLSHLKKDDTYNMYAFNNHLKMLFEEPFSLTPRSVRATKDFLLELGLGNFFVGTNYTDPLFALFQNPSYDEREMHTVIMLTNGEELSKPRNFTVFERWTQIASGGFNLYTVCLQSDKSKEFMELFSRKNKGDLIVASSMIHLKRALHKLINSISTPIAKDLIPTIYASKKGSHIQLSDNSRVTMPNLYANQPYVILGKTDKLDDFILFLQGRNHDGWFHIKKYVSLSDAKEGDSSLAAQWASQEAYKYYHNYISDGQAEHLNQAKALLEPYGKQPVLR